VAWAIQARKSARAVSDLVERWQANHPESLAPACMADLSEQTGEVWEEVREWLRAEGRPVDLLTYCGYGALLWVRSGSIIAHLPYPAERALDKLLAATTRMFESIDSTGTVIS
jgi:hypothetical protein